MGWDGISPDRSISRSPSGDNNTCISMFDCSGNDYSKSVEYWSLGLLCHEIGETGKLLILNNYLSFTLFYEIEFAPYLLYEDLPLPCLFRLMHQNHGDMHDL